jgi:hypothetical protein
MLWQGALAALMTAMLPLTGTAHAQERDHDPAQALAQAAPQQGEDCKDKLNAAGKAKFRPFTRAREIRGEGAAMADAVANWQRDVITKYGRQFMIWEKATETSFYCGPASPGTFGSLFIGCTVEGRPCSAAAPPPEEEGPEREPESCDDFERGRILEAQRRMNGCDACGRSIKVDGTCGPQTVRCLRTFQASRFGREKSLEVNGLPNRQTIRALREFCERG